METLEIRSVLTAFTGIPNDPDFAEQWSLHNAGQDGGTIDADVDAPEAWAVTTGTMQTVVAVMDTGIDYTDPDLYLNIWLNEGEIPHAIQEDLADTDGDGLLTFRDLNAEANAKHVIDINENGYIDGGDLLSNPLWENGLDEDGNGFLDDLLGWDTYDNDNDPAPVANSHGTKSARIIGAVGNNGIGGAGLNWQVRMVPIRAREGDVDRVVSHIVTAFDYAIASGASIVDLGWRGSPRRHEDPLTVASVFSQEVYEAIDRSREAGLLVVAAAGNGSRDTDVHPWYPQSYGLDNVITAAALKGNGDQLALSSNTNWGATTVDVASPTTNGATSRALSITTGAAALVKSLHPEWTYAQIKDRIKNTVDPMPSLVGKTVTGGIVNAAKAVGAEVGTLLFADSFEGEQWNDLWNAADKPTWIRGADRPYDGHAVVMTIGSTNVETLSLKNRLNMAHVANAELRFSWQIENTYDTGEFLALDLFDGNRWKEVAVLRGNVDQEDVWHRNTIQLQRDHLTEHFNFRFRANANQPNERAFVDNVELSETECSGGRIIGDSNLDGAFDTGDLVLVFQRGQYEDGVDGNSGWSDGDWNCDGEFDTSDLVTAFQAGTFEQSVAMNANGFAPAFAAAIDGLFAIQDEQRVLNNRMRQQTDSP